MPDVDKLNSLHASCIEYLVNEALTELLHFDTQAFGLCQLRFQPVLLRDQGVYLVRRFLVLELRNKFVSMRKQELT